MKKILVLFILLFGFYNQTFAIENFQKPEVLKNNSQGLIFALTMEEYENIKNKVSKTYDNIEINNVTDAKYPLKTYVNIHTDKNGVIVSKTPCRISNSYYSKQVISAIKDIEELDYASKNSSSPYIFTVEFTKNTPDSKVRAKTIAFYPSNHSKYIDKWHASCIKLISKDARVTRYLTVPSQNYGSGVTYKNFYAAAIINNQGKAEEVFLLGANKMPEQDIIGMLQAISKINYPSFPPEISNLPNLIMLVGFALSSH